MGGVTHTDIAAYVLGVLDDSENATFEAHLLDCPHCQLDLLEMYDLPEILDEIRRYWPQPPIPAPKSLGPLLDEVAMARRRRRIIGRLAGIAAALLIIAGPLVTLALLPGDPPGGGAAPQVAASMPTPMGLESAPTTSPFVRVDPTTPVRADVILHATAWGAEVSLELSGVIGPVRCQLFAVPWNGDAQVVTTWMVPPRAEGVGAALQMLRVSGGTALAPDEIARFEIRTDEGALLTTIPH